MRATRSSVLLAAVLSTAACASTTAPTLSPVGTYQLVAVDGRALPAPFGTLAGPWFVRGSVEIGADGRYVRAVADSSTCCSAGVSTEIGRWERDADALRLVPDAVDSAPPRSAFLGRATLAETRFGHSFEYARH